MVCTLNQLFRTLMTHSKMDYLVDLQSEFFFCLVCLEEAMLSCKCVIFSVWKRLCCPMSVLSLVFRRGCAV